MSTTKPTKHSTISVSIDLEDPRVPGHIYVSHDNNRMFFGVGDVIRGRVIVDVIHPQAIEEIKIKLVCTVWHKKAAYNNEVDLNALIASNLNHRRSSILYEHEIILVNALNEYVFEKDFVGEWPFVEGTQNVLKGKRHEFPFYFKIAGNDGKFNVPASYEDSNIKVLHVLKVGVIRPQPVRPVACAQAIEVIQGADVVALTAQMGPLSESTVFENRAFGVLGGGLTTIKVGLPRNAFQSGETIPISLRIKNKGVKSIKAVQIFLIRTLRYCGLDGKVEIANDVISQAEHPLSILGGTELDERTIYYKISGRVSILRQLDLMDNEENFLNPSTEHLMQEMEKMEAKFKKTPPPTFFTTSLYTQPHVDSILDVSHRFVFAFHIGTSGKTKKIIGSSSNTISSAQLDAASPTSPSQGILNKAMKLGTSSKIIQIEIPLRFYSALPSLEEIPPGPPVLMGLPIPTDDFFNQMYAMSTRYAKLVKDLRNQPMEDDNMGSHRRSGLGNAYTNQQRRTSVPYQGQHVEMGGFGSVNQNDYNGDQYGAYGQNDSAINGKKQSRAPIPAEFIGAAATASRNPHGAISGIQRRASISQQQQGNGTTPGIQRRASVSSQQGNGASPGLQRRASVLSQNQQQQQQQPQQQLQSQNIEQQPQSQLQPQQKQSQRSEQLQHSASSSSFPSALTTVSQDLNNNQIPSRPTSVVGGYSKRQSNLTPGIEVLQPLAETSERTSVSFEEQEAPRFVPKLADQLPVIPQEMTDAGTHEKPSESSQQSTSDPQSLKESQGAHLGLAQDLPDEAPQAHSDPKAEIVIEAVYNDIVQKNVDIVPPTSTVPQEPITNLPMTISSMNNYAAGSYGTISSKRSLLISPSIRRRLSSASRNGTLRGTSSAVLLDFKEEVIKTTASVSQQPSQLNANGNDAAM